MTTVTSLLIPEQETESLSLPVTVVTVVTADTYTGEKRNQLSLTGKFFLLLILHTSADLRTSAPELRICAVSFGSFFVCKAVSAALSSANSVLLSASRHHFVSKLRSCHSSQQRCLICFVCKSAAVTVTVPTFPFAIYFRSVRSLTASLRSFFVVNGNIKFNVFKNQCSLS